MKNNLITALIFINISPLHNKHYKVFIFHGKYMLATNENSNSLVLVNEKLYKQFR